MKFTSKSFAAALLTASLVPASAYASCDDVGSSQWNELSAQMSQAYDAGDYETALKYGKSLTLICDRSPITNFIMSEAYNKLGKEDESHVYIRRATDYLSQYDVPQALVEKIWLRRAEFELPYKKQAEALQKDLDDTKLKLEAEESAFAEQLEANSAASQTTLSDSFVYYNDRMENIQWTGTGLAAGGGALIITGAALVGYYYPKANDAVRKIGTAEGSYDDTKRRDQRKTFNKYDRGIKVGYGMLFGGIGLGIGGTIMAVFAHQQIAALKDASATVSFNVGPNSAMIQVDF